MSAISSCPSILQLLTKDLHLLRISPVITQIRENGSYPRRPGYHNKPKLKNPFWFIRKTRVLHDDHVTPENKTFIQEVVSDKFGPPGIIKGVSSYANASQSLVKLNDLEKHEWFPTAKRTGVLARKIGQYPLWLKNGEKIRTTLLQVIDNHVIKYIPPEQYDPPRKTVKEQQQKVKKYGCLLVGAESIDPSLLTKEYCGLFKDSGVMPKRHIARFSVSPEAALQPGTPLNVTHFRVGNVVDVRGLTIDRGFQGVVKRWGFKGMPASHGVTKTHRRPGNIGGGGEKGRVWPGTKLPGHMGNKWRILRGLKIWRMNTKYNVMWVQGSCIAGDTNSLVYIYDTVLPFRRPKIAQPFPTSFDDELEEPLAEDIWFDDVHSFKEPSIEFKEEPKA